MLQAPSHKRWQLSSVTRPDGCQLVLEIFADPLAGQPHPVQSKQPLDACNDPCSFLRARTEKGLSGRGEADSKRVLKPDLDVPCGPRPLGGSIAAMG